MADCRTTSAEPMWVPSKKRVESSNLQQFVQHINIQGNQIDNYAELHKWSVECKKDFWLEVWQFCDVIGYRGDCIHGDGLAKWGEFNASRDTIW
ncbi:hypothetical protein AKJ18_30975, partial [Vibrio xuii]